MLTFAAALFVTLMPAQEAKAPTQDKAPVLPPYTGPKKRVGVSGFEVKISSIAVTAITPSGGIGSANWSIRTGVQPTAGLENVPGDSFGTGLADVLVTQLIDTKRFIVLERANIADVTAEIDRGKTAGFANDSAIPEGKLLGAQVLFRGAITELSYKKSGGIATGGILDGEVNAGTNTFTATTGIELKMIDVLTGQVLDSVHAEGKITSKNSTLGFAASGVSIGVESFDTSPLGRSVREAIKQAVTKICARADKLPWEARVASINGQGTDESPKLLYLNFGKDSGITVGTELEVFKHGAVVIDPDTKLVLGREDDTLLGTCKLRTVGDKLSVAIYTGTGVVEPGCGVRLVSKAKPTQ